MVKHVTIYSDNKEIESKFIEFSDGAVNVVVSGSLPEFGERIHLLVDAQVPLPNILQEIVQIVYALPARYEYGVHFDYMPYARADRCFGEGQCHALGTFISSLFAICPDIRRVSVTDPHSKVTEEIFKTFLPVYAEFIEVKQAMCLHATLPAFDRDYDFVVAPDAGARDKAREAAEVLRCHLLTASKVRALENGRIISTSIPEIDLSGKSVIIVDDICDGGGTFVPLAQALREAGAVRVDLYVTHGIFAKGLSVFEGVIDNLYAYQLISNYVGRQDLLTFNESKKEIN